MLTKKQQKEIQSILNFVRSKTIPKGKVEHIRAVALSNIELVVQGKFDPIMFQDDMDKIK